MQECQQCLQTVLDLFLWSNADLPVSNLSATFAATCKRENADSPEAEVLCSTVAAKILEDPSGNLGRRAGMLCKYFGACEADLANDKSCLLRVKTPEHTLVTGQFSPCTIEGVQGGRLPASVSVSPGKHAAAALVGFGCLTVA